MSKGSKQRPTDKVKFDNNFDAIFGKKCSKCIHSHQNADAILYCTKHMRIADIACKEYEYEPGTD